MGKVNRQKLLDSEIDHVEFWANWREAGRAMGIPLSPKQTDKYGQYMENAIANFDAESLFIAFEKADMEGWKRYVQDHPPSPEALAVLVLLGLEQHHKKLRAKGGKGKANKYDLIFAEVLAEKGDKPKHKVELELLNKGASQTTINRRLKGVPFPKKKS
jgi:hypothetical protein